MCAIYICICHNNYFMISKLCNIKIIMNTCTKCCDHCLNLCIAINLVESGFLHIQDLSPQRKNCLCSTAPGCLCRSPRRISLHNKYLAIFGIFIRTVSQFAWQGGSLQSCLSSGEISCFSCRFPSTLCKQWLLTNCLSHHRILFQEISELFTYHTINSSSGFTVTQFLFCLTLKLWFWYFYTDYGCHSLTDIFTRKRCFIFF